MKTNLLKYIFGSVRFDWKQLVFPQVIDAKTQTEKEQKQNKYYNRAFWGIYLTILAFIMLLLWPDVKRMIGWTVMVFVFFVAFCATMNAIRFKKNNAGRPPKKQAESFQKLFIEEDKFSMVDQFIHKKYSVFRKMNGQDAYVILNAIKKVDVLRDVAMDPLVQLFINCYKDFLSFSTTRAVTNTVDTKEVLEEIENLKSDLFQNTSN